MGMKKTIHKVAIATIMIIALSAGMTFALLSHVTESVTNVFASDKNLSLELREPQWDGYTFDDTYPTDILPGTSVKPGTENSGLQMAENYLPGNVISKDPMVKNTSDGLSEWVAMKVQYFDENGKAIGKTDFQKKYAKTAYQNDEVNPNFVKISDHAAIEELYMYTRTLDTTAGKNITEPLFSSVIVNKDLTPNSKNMWPTFSIKVTGYAVQSDGVSEDAARQAIIELAQG